MDESEENMSTEDINNVDSPTSVKIKPKKRSLVERELETNLTARVTSPVTREGSSTSRYGRARKLKTDSEFETEIFMKPLKIDVSKQPQAYKMHASNSPVHKESPKRTISVGSSIEDQIENIYNENISLSRFGSEEKVKTQSPDKKFNKVYIRKDLIQKPDTDTVVLIKNMFSPNKPNSHLNNILERSSEKYSLSRHGKALNGYPDTSSVVKTLDFDGKKKKPVSPVTPIKKEIKDTLIAPLAQPIKKNTKDMLVSPFAQAIKKEVKEKVVSKNELFQLEATCEYQVGDLAWARVGTYPFWPCIVTREPFSDMFVKKKLFGRVERSVIHVTFFGDNGRRGWIVDNMLRQYHGRTEFEACRDKFTPESKKKDIRLYAAHFVSEKKLPLWNVSVEEAETLMKEPKRLRIDALYDMLENAKAAKATPSKREKVGKITRTDSDVSLSESLYDTLFSEDDGKTDENNSRRSRNMSLDVSEVVTACLDNMAAKSGIIQIQRQSHMDRWLQKAKSKTPEKNQPKLQVKVERERRKDKSKKKKEGKRAHKTRKNESLGSDTNLLPYQNEHDYSSVNYENHNINDSSNKNTDSASALDSTLDTSTTTSDIGVTVKIENISSSMEDFSQDDIITTVVNDDIVMTDSGNITKDIDISHDEINNYDHRRKVENNNENNLDTIRNEQIVIKEELPLNSINLTDTIQPRRSKRKRQTLEDVNSSITENKAKEPKLDLKNQNPTVKPSPSDKPKTNKRLENKSKTKKSSENSAAVSDAPTATHLENELSEIIKDESMELVSFDCSSEPVANGEPISSENTAIDCNSPTISNLEKETHPIGNLESVVIVIDVADVEPLNSEYSATENNAHSTSLEKETPQNKGAGTKVEQTKLLLCNKSLVDTQPITTENTATESIASTAAILEKETAQDIEDESTQFVSIDCISKPVAEISENTPVECNVTTSANFEEDISKDRKHDSTVVMPFNSKSKPVVVIEPLESEHTVKVSNTIDVTNSEKETSNSKHESTEVMLLNSKENTPVECNVTTSANFEDISKDRKHDSTVVMPFNSKSKPVVVIEPLESEHTVKVSNTIDVTNSEKETSNSKHESMEAMLLNSKENTPVECNVTTSAIFEADISKDRKHDSTVVMPFNSKSKPVVVIEPLESEHTVKVSSTIDVTNSEKETSNSKHESTEVMLLNSKENTPVECNVTTSANFEEDISKDRKHDSTVVMPFNSKSKPVVVIEPLESEHTVKVSNTIDVTNSEKETSNSKHESMELMLLNSKSKPVVVIEQLNYEKTSPYTSASAVGNLEKETSQNAKLEPMELMVFNGCSKPVVVIEPLDMNGLETQFIIKGPKSIVQNNVEKSDVPSQAVQNENDSEKGSLKDTKNTSQVSSTIDEGLENVSNKINTDINTSCKSTNVETKKDEDDSEIVHHESEKCSVDYDGMEVDDCASPVVNKEHEITKTDLNPTVSVEKKAIEVPKSPLVNKIDENLKIITNVVIGEETYIFDRTLSQDYDEIDGDCYDEYSHLPPVTITEEPKNANLLPDNSCSHEETSSRDYCKDKTNNLKTSEKIESPCDNSGSVIGKANIKNDFTNIVSTAAGDVSSIVNEENISNQVTQDNNDRCVFLDQSSKIANVQSANSVEIKRKSPRLSLNRTRNRVLKLNRVHNVLATTEISSKKVNTDPDKCISKDAKRLQDKQLCSKKTKNDPEFLKYMEIRQDALLDEQPDLTQDEINNYLYQNWLYEEARKSEIKKIDDNEQSISVKGFQEPSKATKKKRKPKVERAAELKNVDIRDVISKGKAKSLTDDSAIPQEFSNNHFENKKETSKAFDKEPMPERSNDLQHVETQEKVKTEPDECVKGKAPIINNDRLMSATRRSRRSKEKLGSKKTGIEEKCVLETDFENTNNRKITINRRLRHSKEKDDKQQAINTDSEVCETTQISSNECKMTIPSCKDRSEENPHTENVKNDPVFIKYVESHQDALLDEHPDLTHDEIVTYLYQNWLYEEANKSEIKNIDDNQQSHLGKGQELVTQPENDIQTTKSSVIKGNKDPAKCAIDSKAAFTSRSRRPNVNLEAKQTVMIDTEKCDLETLQSSEMSNTKYPRRTKEKHVIKKTNTTEPGKCVPETAPINSAETTIGRPKENQDTKKATKEPEFVKYLEMRQDALLDEQPDLTRDEIVTYLYKNWLYEEGNKSDMNRIDDYEQFNLVKGINHVPVPEPKKIKKKSKVEKAPEPKNVDIRDMMIKADSKPAPGDSKFFSEKYGEGPNNEYLPEHEKTPCKEIDNGTNEFNNTQGIDYQDIIVDSKPPVTEEINSYIKNNTSGQAINEGSATIETLSIKNPEVPEKRANRMEDAENEYISPSHQDFDSVQPIAKVETEMFNKSNDIDNMEFGIDNLLDKVKDEESNESAHLKIINGFIEFEENSFKSKINGVLDSETASIKSEDSVSITRRGRKEKDVKKSMDDPDFIKYLEARQDALIDEQPDLTQEEIVTYLYKTWFYEESTKSDVKKSDETEQSNLVKGLNQEPPPQPKKIRKKAKVEKDPVEKVDSEAKVTKVQKSDKVLKNADIRDMIHKPKRKATQSKPYYNEDDSDLEEEDLVTFKIFDIGEQNQDGEVIDEVELYFEQLTKPKPNVFKGYVRERVCEICYSAGNLVKCKSCHGTYHVQCVKKETETTEIAGPTRGRKKKRGRKPKGYDPSLDNGSQSDERSQDANNSEEINISIEDEAESHIVIDEDNFETLWENKMKELQTVNEEEYVSDQEIDWQVEPGHCEIVDLKHKEKQIDYSDYKCNKCVKYETPVCFVCKSNQSPKALVEVRQKCQVAHCHRYYHLECLDHWPQTQFNSWEPSKTNKKQIEYIEALSCPRHVCHTCVSDDPRGCKTRFSGDKLARCVKCPATYHSYTKCLPAGSQILTGSQIICPRHYEHRPGKVPCHVNTGWCFICALGGTLICCEYCPTSFHAECLNIKPPEGSYMCEDCETGRLPLYGEMVWVKLGHYRWWPGIVLHPTEIPDNILAVKHSPGEFVVRFFGQYDHYWVNRGRVFPFQEGDSGRISSQKSKIDAAFTTAMEHAQRACEILKNMQPNEEEDLDIASSLLPPHYGKLKVNKPVGGVARRDMDANSLTQCDCDPNQSDPCGPYTHCLNRMLLTECGPLCRAGERCNNRAFEKRHYPRLQAYRTPHRGWGLRTLDDIKQGQFVIEYVGELIDMEEFRRRMCRKHEIRDENFYFLTLDKERMIDAGPKGNLARFMNHCCEPNCETQKWTVLGDVRVGLFALYDIPANSEVTFNYNLECAGIEKKRCLCGAKRCSGYIGAKPKQLQEDKASKSKLPAKRTYKKRKPVEEPAKPKVPKIKIKPIKPRELTEIEKDLLIIKNATNGMSSDSEGSRLSVDDKNAKALKRKRVSFSTDENSAKKPKLAESEAELVEAV